MQKQFGIGGGLEDRAFHKELVLDFFGIRQISIMGDGDASLVAFNCQGLGIFQFIATVSAVADMTNTNLAQPFALQITAQYLVDHSQIFVAYR